MKTSLRRSSFPLVALLVLATLDFSACSPTYVFRAAYEEARILWRREPIAAMLDDERFDAKERTKLRLVLDARSYAEDGVGLNVGGSYRSVSKIENKPIVYLVTAARRDRLQSYTWWFPIVGRVPYKGFFSEAKAREAAADLERQGYDTYVRPSVAFSTLGWFDDPLLSTLLRLQDVTLANIVFHELFHNTVFVPGSADFNESAANFAGHRSSIEFFCKLAPADEDACRSSSAQWQDAIVMSRFLAAEIGRLEEFYRTTKSERALLAGRERIFGEIREHFGELDLQTDRYDDFKTDKLNNASLLHDRVYYRDLDLFEELYRQRGSVARSVRALETLTGRKGNPFENLRELLGGGRWQMALG